MRMGNTKFVFAVKEFFAVAAIEVELFSKNLISDYFAFTLPHNCKFY